MHSKETNEEDESPLLIPQERVPLGFQFAATRAGIKPSGRPDLALATAPGGATVAALFTSNRVVAAPVVVSSAHLRSASAPQHAVLVNSGNANCATGEEGLAAARESCRVAAALLSCAPEQVLPCSTGIIGVPLPLPKLTAALPGAVASLRPGAEAFSSFARAILTTDTRPKVAHRSIDLNGRLVRLAGAAKGAGMIQPRLAAVPHATMLVYLFTDAAVPASVLQPLLHECVDSTFNRISIDGDTSTNDTVLLLASGASGCELPAREPAFAEALHSLCQELALDIVEDGEGVTHVVTLEIGGAGSDAEALTVARAIAHSPLVKTAWAGSDPNWGRLLSSIGASGVAVEPRRIAITLNGLLVCKGGGRDPGFDPAAIHTAMRERRFTIAVDLGQGEGRCRFWTTDLTTDYVHINADYSS